MVSITGAAVTANELHVQRAHGVMLSKYKWKITNLRKSFLLLSPLLAAWRGNENGPGLGSDRRRFEPLLVLLGK